MRTRRSISAVVSLAIAWAGLGVVAGPVSAGGATPETYPGTCPRDATHDLQDYIDGADAGATITLTRENLNEDADITKDLTLEARNRTLQPLLTGLSIRTTGLDSLRVTVQDLRFEDRVLVNLTLGTGHDVRLRRLEVGRGAADARGMRITTKVPSIVTVEGSYIRRDGESDDPALFLLGDGPDGLVVFRAIGNRINLHGNSNSGSGIQVAIFESGSVQADLMNNTIWDVGRCVCDQASGIAVIPYGPIQADVDIVGNTIELSQTNAIRQITSPIGGGDLRLDVFNNIFSHTDNAAVLLDSGDPGSLTFRAGLNDYYASGANELDDQSAGWGNRSDNPRYVDRAAGNLKLKASSPLIDKGLVCSSGGIANLDAAGHGRLSGPSVDMGAYERDAGSASGKALVGTSGDNTLDGTNGDDILCGYGGDDTLRGKGGRDYLDGGSDDDRLTAGEGPDRSFGGSGNDTLCSNDGVQGNDRADGGSGSDKGRTDSGDTRISIESSAAC